LFSSIPTLELSEVGASSVDAVTTTEYSFKPSCVVSSAASHLRVSAGPLDVWVDGAGRLVQARGSVTITTQGGSIHPGYGSQLAGTSMTVTGLRLYDFGTSVHLQTAPPDARSTYGSTISTFAAKPGKCA
jgi:hypothetical protein